MLCIGGLGGACWLAWWGMLLSRILRECAFLCAGVWKRGGGGEGREGGGGLCLGDGDGGLVGGVRMESGLTDGNRIQTWALEEARRRLEAEGILKEPSDKQ